MALSRSNLWWRSFLIQHAKGGDCWRLLGTTAYKESRESLTGECFCMGTGAVADKVDLSKLLRKRASLIGSTLRNRSGEFKARLVSSLAEEFKSELKQGLIKPPIDKVCRCIEQTVDNALDKGSGLAGCY